jgi:hypothetical protein
MTQSRRFQIQHALSETNVMDLARAAPKWIGMNVGPAIVVAVVAVPGAAARTILVPSVPPVVAAVLTVGAAAVIVAVP